MAKTLTPQPVVVTTICSLCDEPWEAHGDAPTTQDCIRLLKAKLASRPWPIQVTPTYVPTWNGYRCVRCGAWVTPNGSHFCNNQWYSMTCGSTTSGAIGMLTQNTTASYSIDTKRPDDGGDPTPVAA